MKKMVWTDTAVGDLESIHVHIARDAVTYADAVILEILESVDRLKRFPELGRKVPETNVKNIREIIVGNYRIIHEVENDAIRILTILHSARLFPESK